MYLFSVYVCGDGESGVFDYECVSVQGWVGWWWWWRMMERGERRFCVGRFARWVSGW